MNATQDQPIEDGHHDATDAQRLAGILTQVRADLALGHSHDATELLRQRLGDAGIELSDADFDAETAKLTK